MADLSLRRVQSYGIQFIAYEQRLAVSQFVSHKLKNFIYLVGLFIGTSLSSSDLRNLWIGLCSFEPSFWIAFGVMAIFFCLFHLDVLTPSAKIEDSIRTFPISPWLRYVSKGLTLLFINSGALLLSFFSLIHSKGPPLNSLGVFCLLVIFQVLVSYLTVSSISLVKALAKRLTRHERTSLGLNSVPIFLRGRILVHYFIGGLMIDTLLVMTAVISFYYSQENNDPMMLNRIFAVFAWIIGMISRHLPNLANIDREFEDMLNTIPISPFSLRIWDAIVVMIWSLPIYGASLLFGMGWRMIGLLVAMFVLCIFFRSKFPKIAIYLCTFVSFTLYFLE